MIKKVMDDEMREGLKNAGVLFKEDKDDSELIQATRNQAFSEILNHKSCGDKNCSICSMRTEIDNAGFKRGAEEGYKFGQKK